VPRRGHFGLTPQFIKSVGGFKVHGRRDEAAKHLLAEAKLLEQAGCFGIRLACRPATISKDITQNLDIPPLGIGAGSNTEGQILVL
ncbi:3-methyl-2-oxobutanoate hydroxymethyltransferase, partial [Francisella tularensis subsp. holarctica]|uniref:3-methyl-2-oxobutanoate hydroxymethyltransferase n=1 Tax=Francisella tularensis TaxID=263 RepID=UPI002381AF08